MNTRHQSPAEKFPPVAHLPTPTACIPHPASRRVTGEVECRAFTENFPQRHIVEMQGTERALGWDISIPRHLS